MEYPANEEFPFDPVHQAPFEQVQPPSDVPVETQITEAELASTGYEVEEDQLTPHETYKQSHPTPDRPSGRIP